MAARRWDYSTHPLEVIVRAALPAERRVLDFGELTRAARRGGVGEMSELFEHPAGRCQHSFL